MRYSQALSLVRDLKAVTVSSEALAEARRQILAVLARWSPVVEACPFDPAAFWLGAGGLGSLYGTEAQWGASIRTTLAEAGYRTVVVVGLTRGGTYVLAKGRRRSTVIRSAEAEQRALDQAPLSIFPLAPRYRRLLTALGLKTLTAVLKIPAEELSRRFGPDLIQDLRRLELFSRLPLQSEAPPAALILSRRLEPPVADFQALLPLLEAPLQQGLDQLAKRARLLSELRLVFLLESHDLISEVIRPAEPTASLKTLRRLIDLRLARCAFSSSVAEIRLAFEEVPLPAFSGELFVPPTVRDPRRGAEALALIRARWGNSSVVRAVLADSHIPDQSFRWVEADHVSSPRPGRIPPRAAAVRRVPWKGPLDGNPAGRRMGSPCRLRVTAGNPIDREYWFLRTLRGEVAWVSWDRLNGRSRWEGVVD